MKGKLTPYGKELRAATHAARKNQIEHVPAMPMVCDPVTLEHVRDELRRLREQFGRCPLVKI
jgi:hypothetical protein